MDDVDARVQTLPDSPVRLNTPKSLVVFAVNLTVVAPVALYVLVMLVNLFDPVNVKMPAPPWFTVGYVWTPPPANVLELALVRLIVPVPVTVRFVAVAALQPPVPAIVKVPEPIAIVLTEAPEVETPEAAPERVRL